MRLRRLLALMVALACVGWLGMCGYALEEARRDPVIRRAVIALSDWPVGAAPVRVALLSDIHIGSWAMDAGRLDRIVDQVNAQRPDLVLIAGDFINGAARGTAVRLGAPLTGALRRLSAPLGVVAVLGNHDWWTGSDAVRRSLASAGVTIIENQAIRRGPLVIGGVGDAFTRHDQLDRTIAAMRRLPGARLVLTHTPRIARRLPPDIRLLLAGHTHCGQGFVPMWGYADPITRQEQPYICGMVRDGRRAAVVTAGLGTSGVPFRFGVPPDIWLLTLGPGR